MTLNWESFQLYLESCPAPNASSKGSLKTTTVSWKEWDALVSKLTSLPQRPDVIVTWMPPRAGYVAELVQRLRRLGWLSPVLSVGRGWVRKG